MRRHWGRPCCQICVQAAGSQADASTRGTEPCAPCIASIPCQACQPTGPSPQHLQGAQPGIFLLMLLTGSYVLALKTAWELAVVVRATEMMQAEAVRHALGASRG